MAQTRPALLLGRRGWRAGTGMRWRRSPSTTGFTGAPGRSLPIAFRHDSVPGVEAAVDHPVVAEAVAGNDLPGLRLVVGADDVNGLQSLEFLDGLLRNADRARIFECGDDDAHEQARAQARDRDWAPRCAPAASRSSDRSWRRRS